MWNLVRGAGVCSWPKSERVDGSPITGFTSGRVLFRAGSSSDKRSSECVLMKRLLAIVGYCLLSVGAFAACSGSSPNWTAASASQADVQACITAASNGDTIHVPAGTPAAYSGITVSKDLSIIGAGAGVTNLSGSGACFNLDYSHTTRISGFKFTNCTVGGSSNAAAGKSFRIDHNTFTATIWAQNDINGSCQTPQVHPTGLVDHNTISNYRFITDSTNCIPSDGNYASQEWAKQPPVGNSGTIINGVMQEVVYYEDNTVTNTLPGTTINWVDGNQAGRYVLRFNTVNGSAFNFVEVHSEAGDNRGVQWWEFYNNTISVTGSWFTGAFIRAGSGMMWGNVMPTGVYGEDITLNNVRSCNAQGGGQGKCDGTSSYDQNTSGQSGYACRDQIGRSYDTTLWSGGAYSQPSTPAYFWSNTHAGSGSQLAVSVDAGETCFGGDFNATHIKANRDFYVQNASFNGTSGVGVGTLAARPTTCTAGVGYWATDQGNWNQSGSGGQGVLFKCTATNTWTLYYTPLTYPHPLVGSTQGPAPPTSLSVVVQ